jgi:ComF family protein
MSLVEEHVRRLMEGVQLDLALNVPLHRRRLVSREFDQAGLLAQAAAEVLGIPFFSGLLIRATATRSQTAVEKKDRWKNVRNAFGLTDAESIKGKSVLLVDDVFTSGATVNACTRTLKKGGAAAVHVFTLARAV